MNCPSWINPTPVFSCADPYPVVRVEPSTSSNGRWCVRTSEVRLDYFWDKAAADRFAEEHNAHC